MEEGPHSPATLTLDLGQMSADQGPAAMGHPLGPRPRRSGLPRTGFTSLEPYAPSGEGLHFKNHLLRNLSLAESPFLGACAGITTPTSCHRPYLNPLDGVLKVASVARWGTMAALRVDEDGTGWGCDCQHGF